MPLHSGRIDKIRAELEKQKFDFYLIQNPANLFYILGTKAEGLLWIEQSRGICHFISDSRYKLELEGMKQKNFRVYMAKESYRAELNRILSRFSERKKAALEPTLPLSFFLNLKAKHSNFKFETAVILNKLRMVKDESEIEDIKQALNITKKALSRIEGHLFSKTELEVQAELEFKFRKLGAEGIAFQSIVAAGKKSAYPHYLAGTDIIKNKDGFVLIDCGAKFRGYCADLTRMYFWNRIPSIIKRAYKIIEEAQNLAFSLIREGSRVKEIVLKVEKFIGNKGFGNNIYHALGHGVGIDVHEMPVLSRNSKEILKTNMVLAVEPGLYFPGVGGVRKEDLILVQKNKGVLI